MTNKEKAKELASKYARQYHHNIYPQQGSNSEFVFSNEEIDKACLKMAEWKDEQFSIERKQLIEKANKAVTQSFENGAIFKKQEMIEKACKWLLDHVAEYKYYDPDFSDGSIDVDDLVDTFKKEMED